jgi:hypothetical protein
MTRVQLVRQGGGATLPAEEQAMLQEALLAVGEIQELLTAMLAYSEAGAGGDSTSLGLLLRGVLMERRPALRQVGGEAEIRNELDTPAVRLAECPQGTDHQCL